MKTAYVRAMDALYFLCVAIAGICIVMMALVIPYGVFVRYVLSSPDDWSEPLASGIRALAGLMQVKGTLSWPEPAATILMIFFSFLGGAACYRAGVHISVTMFVGGLTGGLRKVVTVAVELAVAALAMFMVIWGFELVATTWHQVIAEFPWLSVGITYLPVPVSGLVTLFFVAERLLFGPPEPGSLVYLEPPSVN